MSSFYEHYLVIGVRHKVVGVLKVPGVAQGDTMR